MLNKKGILPLVLTLSILSIVVSGCSSVDQSVTFSQLISQADKYNGKTVMLEAFYFSGFEISAISESVGPASSDVWRIVPTGTLVWVAGGISQELQNKLYTQTATPSGYPEHYGKLKVTGIFETGGRYGHLDAYLYQIAITNAELLEWTPPPATSTPPNGNLQTKVTDLYGKPLQGAKVVSEEQPDGQLKVTGLTDASGTVTFNDIKSGNYRFYVSHADYVQTEITVTVQGGQTTSVAVSIAAVGQALDDIVPTPGGPAYRANIQQQGVSNPWPLVQTATATLDNSDNPAQITYRDSIETAPGQNRNNLFYVTLPNVNPYDRSLPALAIALKAENLPAGIFAIQDDLQWHNETPPEDVLRQ